MMVSRLVNDDWSFGNGYADYLQDERAIYQNVLTRLRSFKYDWFLDTEAHIDWITLLGMKNSQSSILKEVERVVLNTAGVLKITQLSCDQLAQRQARLRLKFVTVYNNELELNEVINGE